MREGATQQSGFDEEVSCKRIKMVNSKDGRDGVYVFQSDTNTYKQLDRDWEFKEGGEMYRAVEAAVEDEGFVCKVKDVDRRWYGISEEWTYIKFTEGRMCDGTKSCEAEVDEPDFCQQEVVIVGPEDTNAIFIRTSVNTYREKDGKNSAFKNANGSWVIAKGSDSKDSVTIYKSGESSELLHARGWVDGDGKSKPSLQIFEVPANLKKKEFEVDGGFVCQSARQLKNWLFLADDGERRCDATTHCQSGFDEEVNCKRIKMVESKDGRDGVYIYHNATSTYNHLDKDWEFGKGGEMYKEGKAAVEKGFTCRVMDRSSNSSIEEWTYISNDKTDPRFCDDHTV